MKAKQNKFAFIKHALVFGAGRSGRAVAALLEQFSVRSTLVDDNKSECINASEAIKLDFDTLVLSPGIPRTNPLVAHALKNNCLVLNEIDLASELLAKTKFIGVTGTNGKSTVTALIGAVLKLVDKNAFIGGNLGTPLSEAITQNQAPSYCVLELSSYQLETIQSLKLDVALLLNLAPDHLDRYENLESYYSAKQKIFSLLKQSGIAFRPEDIEAEKNPLPSKLLGAHNEANVKAATLACKALGISRETIAKGILSFGGLKHRMEVVLQKDRVLWVNDSKATNIDACKSALKSTQTSCILILGGQGKKANYEDLKPFLGPVKLILAIGKDASHITSALSSSVKTIEANTLENACKLAKENAVAGDTVLLSPACASFDQFANFEERGDTFRELVQKD